MNEAIELAGNYSAVVAIGGIGALLGAWSLWLRYREVRAQWARRLCLFSDVLNTTFVSITVVGVLTVSFELAIHLPNLSRSQDVPERVDLGNLTAGQSDIIEEIRKLGSPIPPEVNLSVLATRDEIRALIRAADRRDLHTIIADLHEAQALNKNSLARAVGRVLGNMGAYKSISLTGYLPESGRNWTCHNDGPFRCTIDSH